ncbi:MAG: alanine racemase [Streptosporangiaceae bacterium]|jgi:alanine racemase|nr:alanine racemase [Streptosporangiaceae bacterium]
MDSMIRRTGTTDVAQGTHARIDLAAISANTSILASAAKGTPVMAVVKSNAYGHGLVPAARAALAGGASRLGVAHLEDALALRRADITAPILAWLPLCQADYDAAILADIELGVETPWRLALITEAAERNCYPARVHLEVDTGMSRGGATRGDWPLLVEAARRAQGAGRITVTGVFSHFACSDIPGHPSITAQLDAFEEAVGYAAAAGVEPELRHLANSAALLTLPETHYDLVRTGLAVYGLNPVEALGDFGLRPAMTLCSTVAAVKRIPAGTGVMYGLTYRAPADTTVAVVPVGYADGLPRGAGTAGIELVVAGRRHRIAGVVGMEQTVLDVGQDLPSPGEEVVLFGPGDDGELTVVELARRLDMVPAEIVARIPATIPRIYES